MSSVAARTLLRALPSPLRGLVARIGHRHGVLAQVTREQAPALDIVLYGMEVCPATRRVRRALGRLDLDHVFRNCPRRAERNRRCLRVRGGKIQLPYLHDPNTGVSMYESRDIVAYLQRTYGPTSPALR